jgi:hypothetical protein
MVSQDVSYTQDHEAADDVFPHQRLLGKTNFCLTWDRGNGCLVTGDRKSKQGTYMCNYPDVL